MKKVTLNKISINLICIVQLIVFANCCDAKAEALGILGFLNSRGNNVNQVARPIATLTEKDDVIVQALAFSPSGTTLAVRASHSKIEIWDWRSGTVMRELPLPTGATDSFTSEPMQFSPDGRFFAMCYSISSEHSVARIFDASTWTLKHEIVDSIPGSGCDAISFSPDSKSLIRILTRTPLFDGDTFIVYDVATWTKRLSMRTVPFYTRTLTISQDGKLAAVGGKVINPKSWRGTRPMPQFGSPAIADTYLIAIFDLEHGEIKKTIPTKAILGDGSRIAWTTDSKHIIAAGGDGLFVLDVASGQVDTLVAPPFGSSSAALRVVAGGRFFIEGASHPRSGYGRIWSFPDRKIEQEMPYKVGSIAVTSDGKLFATGTTGKTVVWAFN